MVCRQIIIYGLCLLCAGCAAGTSYQHGSWMHQHQEADWDLDSAICLQRSETLTDEDMETIERIKERGRDKKESARVADKASESAGSVIGESERFALRLLSGAMSFGGALDEQTAEEKVRESKFSACIEENGWKQS